MSSLDSSRQRTPEEIAAEEREQDLRWKQLINRADNQENNLQSLIGQVNNARTSEQVKLTESADRKKIEERLAKEKKAIGDIKTVEEATDALEDLRRRHEVSRVDDQAADQFWHGAEAEHGNRTGAQQYQHFKEECFKTLAELEANGRWQRPGEESIQREISQLKELLRSGKVIKENGDPLDGVDFDGNDVSDSPGQSAIYQFQLRLQRLQETMNERHRDNVEEASRSSDALKPLPSGHSVESEENLQSFLKLHTAVKAPGGLLDQVRQCEFWKDAQLRVGGTNILDLADALDEAVSEGIIPITKKEKTWDKLRSKDVPVRVKIYQFDKINKAIKALVDAMEAQLNAHSGGRPDDYHVRTERERSLGEKTGRVAERIWSAATATKKRVASLLGATLIGGSILAYSMSGGSEESNAPEKPGGNKPTPTNNASPSGSSTPSGTPTSSPSGSPTTTPSSSTTNAPTTGPDQKLLEQMTAEFKAKKTSATTVKLTIPSDMTYGTNFMAYIKNVNTGEFLQVPSISNDGEITTDTNAHGANPTFKPAVVGADGKVLFGTEVQAK